MEVMANRRVNKQLGAIRACQRLAPEIIQILRKRVPSHLLFSTPVSGITGTNNATGRSINLTKELFDELTAFSDRSAPTRIPLQKKIVMPPTTSEKQKMVQKQMSRLEVE